MNNFDKLAQALLDEEKQKPIAWWYLSFADAGKNNGVVMVQARGITSSIVICNILGINPHGEVMAVPIPPDKTPDQKYTYRILTREEVAECFGEPVKSLREFEEDEKTRPN